MVDYNRDIQNAVAGVSEAPAVVNPNVVTFSTGVQLKKKNFPVRILLDVMEKFKYPPVPKYWDAQRERDIQDPDRKEYQELKAEVDTARGLATIDAVIAFGTELAAPPPDTIEPSEGTEWIEDLNFVGIPVRDDNRKARYLAWVKYVAAPTLEDMALLTNWARTLLGVPGETVAQAITSFPSDTQR